MNPIEFVLWMNGATGVLGDEPPSPAQWALIKEKMGSAVAKIVADRLLDRADEMAKAEVRYKMDMQAKNAAMLQYRDQAKAALGQSVSNQTGKMAGISMGLAGLAAGTVMEVKENPRTNTVKSFLDIKD